MSAVYRFARTELHPEKRMLLVDGVDSGVGARAFDVLLTLIERRGDLVSKRELIDRVWPDVVVEENNLQVQISALRKVLGPEAIATIPGRGYRFAAALDGAAAPEPSAPTTALGWRGNLNDALSPLYGRESDLRTLLTTMHAHRIVTLVGAGGIGKTRLALAAAHAQRERWVDGVWLVEFAPRADPALVASAVAQALGLALAGGKSACDELADALRGKSLLLVLDNCEHLLEAAGALVAAVHARAPGVTCLVTSQEPLHIAEEQQFRLNPLTVPTDAQVANVREFGAVTLFEARARAADPRFELNVQNIGAVVEICQRLDGLALAIELAAARVPLLGVDGVRARLNDRFRVLTAGARLALRRHQTLRGAIEWSVSLLDEPQRVVFRRLGVFAGTFGLGSAQRVAADGALDEWVVLDHLGALVDKSLVVVEPSGEPRYRLLETSRAFALEKLSEAGETDAALLRHAQAMLAVFEESYSERYTSSIRVLLDRYLPDLDNLRTALDWADSDAGDPDLLIALTGASSWIWKSSEQHLEGLRRSARAISRIGPTTLPAIEARLQATWWPMAYPRVGAPELAAGARAIALYRALGDDIAASHRTLEEAQALFDSSWPPALREPLLTARSTWWWVQGRHEEARLVCEELFRLSTAIGDDWLIMMSLVFLEQCASSLGRLDEAVTRGRDLIERVRRVRFVSFADIVHGNLSTALTELGRVDEALDVARQGLPWLARSGRLSVFLHPLALLAFKCGRPADAARVLGAADGRFATTHLKIEPNEKRVRETLVAQLREVMPIDELQRLMKEGAALSDEDAAALALGAMNGTSS